MRKDSFSPSASQWDDVIKNDDDVKKSDDCGRKDSVNASDLNSDILPYGVLLVILSPEKTLFVDYYILPEESIYAPYFCNEKAATVVDAKGWWMWEFMTYLNKEIDENYTLHILNSFKIRIR